MNDLGPIHQAIIAIRDKARDKAAADQRRAQKLRSTAEGFVRELDQLVSSPRRHEHVGTEESRGQSFAVGSHANITLPALQVDTDSQKGPKVAAIFEPISAEPLRYRLQVESPLGIAECAVFEFDGSSWLMRKPGSPEAWHISAESIAEAIAEQFA